MTTLLQCRKLNHNAGMKPLFRNLSLTIMSGDKIGLVGHNGSGKSTLFSLLNGRQQADEGEVTASRSLVLETVEQFIDTASEKLSLFDALAIKLPESERAFHAYKAEMTLQKLGFSPLEFGYRVEDVSGGQQNRLMFARAVINEPNLILFDEPTNHLDLATIVVFEHFLKNLDAAFLVISHDREFLDAVTNRTLFLRDERLYSFNLPYSAARQALTAQDEAAAAKRRSEEKNIDGLRDSAKRIAMWARAHDNEKLHRKAKSMQKRVEKMEANKTFVTKGSDLKLSLEVADSRAKRLVQIEDLMVRAPGGNQDLFYIQDFFMRPGDRVALLGANGSGKTTLIQMMLREHEEQTLQKIRFNPQCKVGYYDQELKALDASKSLIETLRIRCNKGETQYKAALIKAGFPYDDMDKLVRVLSGGEKARLMFLVVKLNKPNFLILDEPTNHIDIQGKEELEEQILEAGATTLVTSHDRRFIDNIAQRFVVIEGARLREIYDPHAFYQASDSKLVQAPAESAQVEPKTVEADDILYRIVFLEDKLEADLNRKPKHQKPELQESWQKEIEELTQKL